MPVIVVAPAGNAIDIPVAVYATMEDANRELTKTLGIEPRTFSEKHPDWLEWDIPEKPIGTYEKYDEYWKKIVPRNLYIQNRLFYEYYDGCGPCISIIAIPIEFGELKRFAFNLD